MNTKSFITSSTITLILVSVGFLGSILLDKCKGAEQTILTFEGKPSIPQTLSWDYASDKAWNYSNDNGYNDALSNADNFDDIMELMMGSDGKIPPYLFKNLQNSIDGSKGTIVYFSEINKTIKDSLMKVEDINGRLMFPHTDSFNIYTSFSRIKRSMLYSNSLYRNKLVDELNNYHKDAFDSLLNLHGRDTTATFLNEFSRKWTTTQHIGYLSDTIESNFYSMPNDNNKIITQFDVSAVCPPVCPN